MPTFRQRMTASVARMYPFLSGCGTFANSKLVQGLAGSQGGLAWGRLHNGAEVLVPLEDYGGRAIYYVGELDRKITRVIDRVVSRGDTVIDIGANLGMVTMQLSRIVGDEGVVHAFEPNPVLVDLLSQTVQRNGVRNVKLHPFALGAEEGNLELNIPPDNAGRASLTPPNQHLASRVARTNVAVRPFSSFAAREGLSKVKLVKIDVEGFEQEVFRGAEEWLSTSPPDFILFESNPRDEMDPAARFLQAKGFEIFAIAKNMFLSELFPLGRGDHRTAHTHDFLAIHRDSETSIRSKLPIRD